MKKNSCPPGFEPWIIQQVVYVLVVVVIIIIVMVVVVVMLLKAPGKTYADSK